MTRPFEPITIGSMTLKNRIMMAPMETGLADPGGYVSDQLVLFYEERVRNDVAIAVTGSATVSPEGRGLPRQLGCYDESFIPGLARLAEAVHRAGGRIAGQIYHAGRQATRAITGLEPMAPSPIPCPIMNDMPREMTRGDIEAMVEKFGQGAVRMMKAGFDMVEVHLAHGYLLFGFLSPAGNRRRDEYGGSLENRLRFPLAVVGRIREEVGSRMAVTARISADEFIEGGFSFEEAMETCRALVGEGIQAISVSAGSYASVHSVIQPFFYPRGFLSGHAERLKEIVDVPVIVAGRINTPSTVEEILGKGQADMVALGRALVCDPEFVTKMRQGRTDAIRPCVACNQGCADRVITGASIACLLNAEAGREEERVARPAARARRVMVVGGGPAGMEAARVAALRGHDVLLVEKEEELGGRLLAASKAPGKAEFAEVPAYFGGALRDLGVRVRLGESDPVRVRDEFRPEAVVFAAGAEPAVPPIPGIDGGKVVTAEDVLRGRSEAGPRAVIVGGGMVGVETALYLAERGAAVTVVEMTGEIAADAGPINRIVILAEVGKKGIEVLTGAEVRGVTPRGVTLRRGKETREVAADTVVLATSYRPASRDVLERLGTTETAVVGDANGVRNILEAVHEGYLAGCRL